jgi:hypothetical protein
VGIVIDMAVRIHGFSAMMTVAVRVVLLLLPMADCAAQSGSISGVVWDRRSDLPIGFASVSLVGGERVCSADDQGRFEIRDLDTGRYDVRVVVLLYGDTTLHGIQVLPDTPTFLKVVLPKPCVYDSRAESGICPICAKRDAVIPIQYGLIIGDERNGLKMIGKQGYALDQGEWYIGGCTITTCDPNWFCRTDSLKF